MIWLIFRHILPESEKTFLYVSWAFYSWLKCCLIKPTMVSYYYRELLIWWWIHQQKIQKLIKLRWNFIFQQQFWVLCSELLSYKLVLLLFLDRVHIKYLISLVSWDKKLYDNLGNRPFNHWFFPVMICEINHPHH